MIATAVSDVRYLDRLHTCIAVGVGRRQWKARCVFAESFAMKFGECSIPHPDKVDYGGEDAYFYSTQNGGACGVSDGVGGWQESGINPAEYSQGLMNEAKLYFEHVDVPEEKTDQDVIDDSGASYVQTEPLTTLGALTAAHTKTRKPGSATACILKLNETSGELEASNLGDSGFLVIRNGAVVFQTPVQEHFFDCPYQLGAAPEYVPETDYPSDAVQTRQQAQDGDLIVMATDGLWDNVDVVDIVKIASKGDDLDCIAKELGNLAFENSQDSDFESPYAIEARKAGMELSFWDKLSAAKFTQGGLQLGQVTGGKMDDITVLVASVVCI